MSRIKLFFSIVFSISFGLTVFSQQAEVQITDATLLPMVRTEPYPSSGVVKINSPHFIWAPVIEKFSNVNTYTWNYNYYYQCRISDSKNFDSSNTITSEVLEWTFFIPNKPLSKGIWYWQFATIDKTTNVTEWSAPIQFKITGKERQFLAPSSSEFVSKIPKEHPRFLASKEDIGNMNFSEKDKKKFLKSVDSKLNVKLPKTLIYNDKIVLDKKKLQLSAEKYHRYIDKATKEKYKPEMTNALNMIKAYIITGDNKYKKEGLRRYYYLKFQYEDIQRKGFLNDFTEGFYYSITESVFDAFYDDLSEKEQKDIVELLVKNQEKTYHHFLYNSVLELMSSHRWQHHMRNFFTTSLTLLHHTPKAEKWVKYVYDLWSIRAPIGSGNDGAWIAGNGYMGANLESLFVMPFILSKYTGVDFFEHPWYQNVPSYLFLTAPVGHISGGFGDNADVKRTPTIELIYALNKIKDNAYGKEYVRLQKELGVGNRQNISKGGNMFWFSNQKFSFSKGNQGADKLVKAKVFPDAGIVAMHTDLKNINNNLMLTFKSSPYGVTGHAHASQNTFNIQYGGEPLFYRTGYYSSWCDFHSLQSYRHTRAQNGILANGMGASFFSDGYGWIPRFIEGKEISYTVGDASKAYDGTVARDEYLKEGANWNVEFTPENGFGKPGVQKFRRHITMLRPSIIVIYDELTAEKPVNWSWLVHSKDTLNSKEEGRFYSENKFGRAELSLFSNTNHQTMVTDQFYAPAVDWLGNGAKKGIPYINHWHGKVETEKSTKTRFITIIQVLDKKEDKQFQTIERNENNQFSIGDWLITVELDTAKIPSLEIVNTKTASGLSFGNNPLIIGKKKFNHKTLGSTILVEPNYFKEVIDRIPDAAIYK